ncbi:Cys-loop ligand-gated ion channel subunit-like protein [Operophtera brumata]|uniref:Cys-loop ligand-gated ion channel subunit-like protein n=1 Tax=Operophtera brumata TaxID=104452 RepID=A0A0L7KYA6_OPEBR|nr:Cys-loop ligand-gated ion channel subunit-like protein [Operophtera brumata]
MVRYHLILADGASLAQLTSLTHLDLSHNFLRSLSAEPLKSLSQLSCLLLHDNDISMIDDGALAMHKDLTRFTIEGTLLNAAYNLRSLSAEPLKSLSQLSCLLLHDNDISMIDDGALAMHKDLTRFTIEGTLLNAAYNLRSLSAEPLKSLSQLSCLLLHDNDISMIDDEALAMHKDLTRFTIEGTLLGSVAQLPALAVGGAAQVSEPALVSAASRQRHIDDRRRSARHAQGSDALYH